MKEFLIAVVSALLGALAMKFIPKFMKSRRKRINSQNVMNDVEEHQQCEQNEDSQNDETHAKEAHTNETRPASVAIIYRSELDYISRCILDYPNIETGGQLFGFWTNDGVPVVLYAIGPGKNADHQVAFFTQDPEYISTLGDSFIAKYGLQHVGEWHSHHQLSLASPSGHDVQSFIHEMKQYNKHQFLLCIGNCDGVQTTLNAFNFREPVFENYLQAAWNIKELESPFRRIVDNDFSDSLIHPIQMKANHGNLKVINSGISSKVVMPLNYWLNEKENNLVLKSIIDYINANYSIIKTQVTIDTRGIVHLVITQESQVIDLIFVNDFPISSPSVYEINNEGVRSEITNQFSEWEYKDDIYSSVINFLNSKFYD